MKTINYTGSSKLISRIVNLLNRKAPLPLDGNGDPDWGTNGQVLSTDGSGNTAWVNQGGGGDSVSWTQTQVSGDKIAEIDINGTTTNVYAPSNPTVNDATLTITQNGSSLGTFTANASANVTIEVPGGGGSGGHTIWGRLKATLTQRSRLWFADANASDASADDATKVEVVTELLNETAFDNLATDGTADGIYTFPDSGGEYLTAAMSSYDNTASGLSATDVQDAIDELANGIYYKDVAIAGKTISNYYVAFDTGVNSTLYQAIGFASVAGSWDTGLTVEVSTDNYIKLRSARTASYTIASNIKPIRVYFVKANRINATPLS